MQSSRIADIILNELTLDDVDLLDFGCGAHGGVATHLCAYTKHTLAVDSSAQAVAEFNEMCANQNLHDDEVCAMLASEFWDRPELVFDVIVASLVFHHLTDCRKVTQDLAQRLKPNGTLIIIDLMAVPGINGVTEDELAQDLQSAKLLSHSSVKAGPRIKVRDRKTRLLIARGTAKSDFNHK